MNFAQMLAEGPRLEAKVSEESSKVCGICKQRLPLSSFRVIKAKEYLTTLGRYYSRCRKCESLKTIENRRKRLEKERNDITV